jgi:dienelactone hydrolase
MNKIITMFACLLIVGCASVEKNTIKVNDATAHIYEKKVASPTILYVPGCSGLDSGGRSYQNYHLSKFKEVWPDANIVVSQYVNDITRGSSGGRCDWDGADIRLKDKQSWHQAEHTIRLAEWVKTQPWSNGEVHLFGFSWGGRVGIWIPGSEKGQSGVFKSVALIWPDCRPIHKIRAGNLHTPTRIWATENDPLSIPKNCPSYYVDKDKKLTLSLFPGETHSWMTGPAFTPYTRWWPQQKVNVRSEFNESWANQTFIDWKNWAKNF